MSISKDSGHWIMATRSFQATSNQSQIKQFTMSEDLKITKEKVLEAASKCSIAKETLKTLFPEAFKENRHFNLSKLPSRPFSYDASLEAGFKDNGFLQVRATGANAGIGFFLDNAYDWEMVIDNDNGCYCLIPKRKQK